MPIPSVAVFDAYGTLFDVHSAVRRVAGALGIRAERVSALWRQKQLEYSWTRSLIGRYADFWQVTEEALDHALAACALDDAALRGDLLEAYRKLDPYRDVRSTLMGYRELGVRVAVFSNATPAMLHDALESAQLASLVDVTCSTHVLKRYKPDPDVYAYASKVIGAEPEAVVFHSSNAWDAAGASSFGWHTFWINRAHGAPEYTWAGLNECPNLDTALASVRTAQLKP
ncbi:MAG: haloacid dehalogenase type II [Rhodanobacter sp.]|nr:MAG: haloacid dehalogenase type II [Rhodanobacter sp.]TAM14039.1 MAG: haloacid dehalogenase type II [Rhodanobacter sp.]TAM37029.1 MAG: haloacid dehalogenase type II [Rhodanobacter sp.]